MPNRAKTSHFKAFFNLRKDLTLVESATYKFMAYNIQMNDVYPAEQEMNHEAINSPELVKAMELAQQAGEILKKHHGTGFEVDYKKDEFDPVTIADKESDELLRTGISNEFPDDEILSEESPLQPSSYEGRVWMVDPLDDTKGYVAGRDTSSVMIGLLDKGRPMIGVVYMPMRNEWYWGEAGKGSYRLKDGITTKLQVPTTTTVTDAILVGRNPSAAGDVRPIEEAVTQIGFKSTVSEGSVGAKIGLIAAGEADAHVHTNLKAGKWDTLAAEVILSEAGGPPLCDVDGCLLDYTKPESGWDRYFMAACTPELLQEMVTQLGAINEQTHSF